MVDGDEDGLRVISVKRELSHAECVEVVLVRHEVVNLVLVVVADGGDVEELEVVLEGDPEAAVVLVLPADLRLCVVCPLRRFVAPVALPLLLAPGVTDLDQALRVLAVVELD